MSSHAITQWTEQLESETLLYLIGKDNRLFENALTHDYTAPKFSTIIFEMMTHITPNEPQSFLGHVIPGYPYFGQRFVIGGTSLNNEFQMVESAPPLEEIMQDRQAVFNEITEEDDEETSESPQTTAEEVVFIYNTHNRESFLPHLPDVKKPKHAYHESVNITKASEHFAKALTKHGIRSQVDTTDFTNILHEKNWDYPRSYDASREVIKEVFQTNEHIQYVFDIHRDSLPKDKTTLDVDGKSFGKILFIIGAENAAYEKNLTLATELHERLEEKQPGLSRGVITKEGPGSNGLYNQDLLQNSLLIEIGGYDNELEHINRSVELLADVFSDYYWDAEEVHQTTAKGN